MLIHVSISERTCAVNYFHLPSLTSAKDLVQFTDSQWTLSKKLVVCLLLLGTCIVLLSHFHRLIHAFTSAGMLYAALSVHQLLGHWQHWPWLHYTRLPMAYSYLSVIQLPCLCRDCGSLGTALHASSSRSANSPEVLHKRRGIKLLSPNMYFMFDTGQ